MRLIESHHAPLSPTRSDHQILVLPQPVGINQSQSIPSFMNVTNIAVCGASVFFTAFLIYICNRCKADIGALRRPHQPSKTRFFFFFRPGQTPNVSRSLPPQCLTLPLQLSTTGSLLEQGSTALVVFTAIHAGLVAGLSWALLANAIITTQVVEDGTLSSLVVWPSLLFDFALIARYSPTTYSQSYSLP